MREHVLQRASAMRRRRRLALGGGLAGALGIAVVLVIVSSTLGGGTSGLNHLVTTDRSPDANPPTPTPHARPSPSASPRPSAPAPKHAVVVRTHPSSPVAMKPGPTQSSTGTRQGAANVYDPSWRSVVVYGGTGPSGVLHDTWAWSQRSWQRLSTDGPTLDSAALGIDPKSGALLLIGMTPQAHEGSTSLATGGATWKWTAQGWAEIRAVHTVVAGYYRGVVNDTANHRLLVYVATTTADGSYNASAQLWAWDGTDWTRVWVQPSGSTSVPQYVAAGPSGELLGISQGATAKFTGSGWSSLNVTGTPMYITSVTSDPATGDVYVIGSSQQKNPDGPVRDDGTYRFDGTRWTRLTLPQAISDRYGPVTVWDASTRTLVLADGEQGLGFVATPPAWYHDTWVFRGGTWTQVAN